MDMCDGRTKSVWHEEEHGQGHVRQEQHVLPREGAITVASVGCVRSNFIEDVFGKPLRHQTQ